jgi:hypothetical protein
MGRLRTASQLPSQALAIERPSIEVTQIGVDAGTRYFIAVGPGGTACRVTGLSQDYGGRDWKGPAPHGAAPPGRHDRPRCHAPLRRLRCADPGHRERALRRAAALSRLS